MQTENIQIGGLDLNPTKFLSLAMTALRLSVPAQTSAKANLPVLGNRDSIITLEEISWHDHEKDCWVVIYDRVYDLTHFFDEHPGGAEVLLEYAGRDATIAFRGVGHSAAAISLLDRFLIGELPMHEKIFRTPGGIRLSGIPI